jgi:hypothetical protein
MAEGLRPPQVTEPEAAIGRPLSRMPVIIRSHESSGASMMEDAGWRMECVLKFVQDVDIERYYFSERADSSSKFSLCGGAAMLVRQVSAIFLFSNLPR